VAVGVRSQYQLGSRTTCTCSCNSAETAQNGSFSCGRTAMPRSLFPAVICLLIASSGQAAAQFLPHTNPAPCKSDLPLQLAPGDCVGLIRYEELRETNVRAKAKSDIGELIAYKIFAPGALVTAGWKLNKLSNTLTDEETHKWLKGVGGPKKFNAWLEPRSTRWITSSRFRWAARAVGFVGAMIWARPYIEGYMGPAHASSPDPLPDPSLSELERQRLVGARQEAMMTRGFAALEDQTRNYRRSSLVLLLSDRFSP